MSTVAVKSPACESCGIDTDGVLVEVTWPDETFRVCVMCAPRGPVGATVMPVGAIAARWAEAVLPG